jgi:hypothetical protein
MAVAGSPEIGPTAMRASSALENVGSEELSHVATQAHPEQVVGKLREADRLLSEGSELPEVLKHLEIAEATYHRWRNQYGGMKADRSQHR